MSSGRRYPGRPVILRRHYTVPNLSIGFNCKHSALRAHDASRMRLDELRNRDGWMAVLLGGAGRRASARIADSRKTDASGRGSASTPLRPSKLARTRDGRCLVGCGRTRCVQSGGAGVVTKTSCR